MLANSLRPGGVVLDLFGGSGSTLMAAHGHGSAARLVELDPRYADVVCHRFQEHTGVMPVRDDGGPWVSRSCGAGRVIASALCGDFRYRGRLLNRPGITAVRKSGFRAGLAFSGSLADGGVDVRAERTFERALSPPAVPP
ncbi:site-specific DNA-methyltransferase [Nocardia terpenica]|uniref:site-specific DNA-methyltransferase n=1 Tax=Nocardia terpenica TaxID=455432 RepID=UPI001E38336F|nr:site-specific DNA-methyltransferase [Nocardia terpenica]